MEIESTGARPSLSFDNFCNATIVRILRGRKARRRQGTEGRQIDRYSRRIGKWRDICGPSRIKVSNKGETVGMI